MRLVNWKPEYLKLILDSTLYELTSDMKTSKNIVETIHYYIDNNIHTDTYDIDKVMVAIINLIKKEFNDDHFKHDTCHILDKIDNKYKVIYEVKYTYGKNTISIGLYSDYYDKIYRFYDTYGDFIKESINPVLIFENCIIATYVKIMLNKIDYEIENANYYIDWLTDQCNM